MKAFFSDSVGISKFHLFGSLHFMMIFVMLVCIFLIYLYRREIREWKYHDSLVRYAIAIIMFTNMTVYYGYKLYTGTWDYHVHLPLHFCFISGYLFMYALVKNNQQMFRYVYFFSFAGPLPAILLPDLVCGWDRFIFWQFVLSHHFFMIASMYCLYVLEWKIEKKDALCAVVAANLIFLMVFLFNQIFDTNYIMTSKLPDHVLKLMPFLKSMDMPIVLLEITGILAWMFAYLPVYFMNYSIKHKDVAENSRYRTENSNPLYKIKT